MLLRVRWISREKLGGSSLVFRGPLGSVCVAPELFGGGWAAVTNCALVLQTPRLCSQCMRAHAHSPLIAFWRCFCCVLDAANFLPSPSQLLTAAAFFRTSSTTMFVRACIKHRPQETSPCRSHQYPVHSDDAWLCSALWCSPRRLSLCFFPLLFSFDLSSCKR